jgi:hypothetical protein
MVKITGVNYAGITVLSNVKKSLVGGNMEKMKLLYDEEGNVYELSKAGTPEGARKGWMKRPRGKSRALGPGEATVRHTSPTGSVLKRHGFKFSGRGEAHGDPHTTWEHPSGLSVIHYGKGSTSVHKEGDKPVMLSGHEQLDAHLKERFKKSLGENDDMKLLYDEEGHVYELSKAGTPEGARKAAMTRRQRGWKSSHPGQNPSIHASDNEAWGLKRVPHVKTKNEMDPAKKWFYSKSTEGGNMEAIIKTIDEEYFDKCMDAGLPPTANKPAGSAQTNAGVSSLPGKGGAKKKKATVGSFNAGLPPLANKPAGSAYKSLSEWRMRKGSIAPSFALGKKSSKTVESQTGGTDAPTGYGDRDGEAKLRNTKKKAGKLSGGKKLGENTPAGSAY